MKIINKSAWIHVSDRKMLFLRSIGKEIFYLPGGKPEEGETHEEALVREIKEEAGVVLLPESIELKQHFMIEAHGRPDTKVEIHGYFAEYIGDILPTTEIEEVGWFDSSEQVLVPPAGKLILAWLKEQDLVD